MKPVLYYIGGEKGGVGKSLLSAAIVDYYRCLNTPVALVETDESNADIGKTLKDEVPVLAVDTRTEQAWEKLLPFVEQNPGVVIINSGARDLTAIGKYGVDFLPAIAQAAMMRLVCLWPLNAKNEQDGLQGVTRFHRLLPETPVIIMQGEWEGPLGDDWQGSKAKGWVTGVVQVPIANDMLIKAIKNGRRLSMQSVIDKGNVLEKASASGWRTRVATMMEQVEALIP
ncbi:hypothetical protein NR402_17310 [Acidithiobacillus ferrooxidans]|jgi:hypothetical protein|uniref:hypothetical protein n=1 Tax=Acidithiobacillus ferrooxidans TaxID=920 RepID=UPI00214C8812|nr:hypothetical protein [Acidithiobacillus ferrooxidans]MCR2832007.1 hypothetical protein [Acidithiobacillus ferrooxidans]